MEFLLIILAIGIAVFVGVHYYRAKTNISVLETPLSTSEEANTTLQLDDIAIIASDQETIEKSEPKKASPRARKVTKKTTGDAMISPSESTPVKKKTPTMKIVK